MLETHSAWVQQDDNLLCSTENTYSTQNSLCESPGCITETSKYTATSFPNGQLQRSLNCQDQVAEKRQSNSLENKGSHSTNSRWKTLCLKQSAFQQVLSASSRLPTDTCSRSLPMPVVSHNIEVVSHNIDHNLFVDASNIPCYMLDANVLTKVTQDFSSWKDVQELIDTGIPCQNQDSDIKNGKCHSEKRRRRKKTPVEVKDEKYWERRKKNNLAAKRSRDAKRDKESTKQKRAMLLQIENTQLQLELSWLREQNKNFKQILGVFSP